MNARCRLSIVISLSILVGLSAIAPTFVGVRAAQADDVLVTQQLVERSRLALEAFLADNEMGGSLRAVLREAKAVLIYPAVLRLAFFFGGSGASGVLLARDEKTNVWGGPAFYTIAQGSFGFQAGADSADVILVVLTDRGLSALLSTSAKFGADVGVTMGPIGVGAEAATANLSADIVSYSRAKGLYAGMSVNGAVVAARASLNQAYYGRDLSPSAILISREATNPQAAPLIEAVAKAVGK